MREFKLKYNLYECEGKLTIKRQNNENQRKIAQHGTIYYFVSYNRKLVRLGKLNSETNETIDLTIKELERRFYDYDND